MDVIFKRKPFKIRPVKRAAISLCLALASPSSALALDCSGSSSMADQLWAQREKTAMAQYDGINWKALSAPEQKPGAFTYFVWDRLALEASYGDTYTLDTTGPAIAITNPDNEYEGNWKVTYELPFAAVRKYFASSSSPASNPYPGAAKEAAIQKERLDFYELVGQWRFANSDLELKKLASSQVKDKDVVAKKTAELEVQKELQKVNDLATRIGILAGQGITQQSCI